MFFGGADLGFPCVAMGGGAGPHSVREGEESVVPVRTEGRALVPPIRGGAGARAVVEKGAGRTRAKCPRLRPRLSSPPRGWGLGLHRFGPPGVCGTGRGSPACGFQGAAARGREARVPPPSWDPVGRKARSGLRCHASRPAPAGVSASLAVKRRRGKPAVASGRDLGLRVCPALRPCGWEGLSPTGSGGGVRTSCCGSLVYAAVGLRTLSCSLPYFAPNIVVGAVTAKRVEAWSAAPFSYNYWEEMLSVLSVPAVGCGWCCAHASAAVTSGGGSEPSGAGNVEGANLSWSSLDVQRLCVALWAELLIRGVVSR